MELTDFADYGKRINPIVDLILKALVKSSSKDDVYIESFIKSLLSNDIDSLRLLICIGIDIKSSNKIGHPKHNEYTDTLRKVVLGTQSIAIPKTFKNNLPHVFQFWSALKLIDISQRRFIFQIDDNNDAMRPFEDNCNLSRLVPFDSFITFCVDANSSVNEANNKLRAFDSNQMHTYYDLFKEGKFSTLNISKFGSGTGWVFAMKREEIDLILNDASKGSLENKLIEIVDRLGFYLKEKDIHQNYVLLNYPLEFEEILFQPSALAGDWNVKKEETSFSGNEFFMTYKNIDNWGRTFSISGKNPSLKERTHIAFDYLNSTGKKYAFEARNLKNISKHEFIKAQPEIILDEILDRFDTI